MTKYIGNKSAYLTRLKQRIQLVKDHIKTIKSDLNTKKIIYPEYQEAFDYVDNSFPEAKVKNVIVYRVSRELLNKLGYDGVGGFYNSVTKNIAVGDKLDISQSKFRATLEIDEIIVHELLHYCSGIDFNFQSVILEEEFAYGNSIQYFKNKGFDNDKIIKDYFMPFLVSITDVEKISKSIIYTKCPSSKDFGTSNKKIQELVKQYELEIDDAIIEECFIKGYKIIKVYDDKNKEQNNIVEDEKQYNFVDLIDLGD